MHEIEPRSCQWCERGLGPYRLPHESQGDEPCCLDDTECQDYIDRDGVL